MNTRTILPLIGASAARIFASHVGPRIMLEAPDMAGLARMVETGQSEVKSLLTAAGEKLGKVEGKAAELDLRMAQIEQKMARPGGRGGPGETKSLGQLVAESDQVKSLMGGAKRGVVNLSFETKAILSAPASWGTGVSPSNSLVVADRQPIVALPQRRLVVRDLLIPGQTTSNAIEFPVETVFTNNAAVVAENTRKPESNITFDLRTNNVRTVAHFMKGSRQILDDAPQLQSFIDGRLRLGVDLAEEAEMLFGDGTGQHLLGLVAQATPYSSPFGAITNETMFDTVLSAIAQVETALYSATGVVINSVDWRRMQAIKDGMGRYFGNGPFGQEQFDQLWALPKVATPLMPQGRFMVGAFNIAAQVFDRMTTEVLISTENEDDFVKDMITVRGEKRLALCVYRPQAVVYGQFPT